ncbi:MAG: sensor histidine kinase [Chloroflexota bacterium]
MSLNPTKQTRTLSDDNLLTIFRVAILSRFVLAGISYLVVPSVIKAQTEISLLNTIDTLLLSIYLFLPVFRHWLGKYFLSIALLWATVIPLLITTYSLYLFLVIYIPSGMRQVIENIENLIILSNVAPTVTVLLVPLLLISWRDTWRTVARFCVGTSLFDAALIVIFIPLTQTSYLFAFTLIGFRMIILGMVGFILNKVVHVQRTQAKALQEANENLRDANRQLRDYATTREHLIASQERNRIAREMHDTLAHSLAAVTVQLEAVRVIWDGQPEQAKELVDESAEMVRSGLAETRRALQSLRAETLESIGFVESIHELTKTTQAREGVQVTVDVSGEFGWLTNEQEHVLYRIVQEAVYNSAKHAVAQQIAISIWAGDTMFHLSIVDDGMGFDPQLVNTNGHFGIQGMRERAELIGAKFDINSQVEHGTTIQVNLERTKPDAHLDM